MSYTGGGGQTIFSARMIPKNHLKVRKVTPPVLLSFLYPLEHLHTKAKINKFLF